MISLDSARRRAENKNPSPTGTRGLEALLAVPPLFPSPTSRGGDLVAGTAPTLRDDTLGSDNAAPAAKPTWANPFGWRLPGPFGRCAGAGLAPTPGSLGPASRPTSPVRSRYDMNLARL